MSTTIYRQGIYRRLLIQMESRHTGGRQFLLSCYYKGTWVHVSTNDTTIWDWLDDESNKDKHKQALRDAYNLIKSEYNQL